MKKRFFPVFLVFLLPVFICGCIINLGDGNVIDQERNVQGFNSVLLSGAGDVYIFPGSEFKVVVTTDSNLQEYVTTKVKAGILYIDENSFRGFHPTKLVIDVYLPELTCVKLRGAGNIKVNDGNISDFEIVLSGAGNIDAKNFEAENVSIILSGAGDIKTWATDSLTGKLSGVGSIMYRGDPPIKDIRKTGVGSIGKI